MGKVDITKHKGDIFVLKKEYHGLSRNVKLGCVYVVPDNSTHVQQDVFNILEKKITSRAKVHKILICGNYNGHTGRLPDFSAYFVGE